MGVLKNKTVVLGVSGGIAAYKAASLCSKLVQAGADVQVIMTESAARFVAPLTFQTLSRHAVMMDTFDERDPGVVTHIHLADLADLVVVAPATANIIGKYACGIADDMLSTTLLATTAPVLVAPAMNVHMYAHPAVQHNMETLKQRGVAIYEPTEGQLACGYVGKGRLAEPEDLLEHIVSMLGQRDILRGKRLLVTAGGTVERIDPVRYLTNDSSGKMGYAIAETARRMGAEVTLVSGKTSLSIPEGVNFITAGSAEEMYTAVMEHLTEVDIVIKAAAVADYRPVRTMDHKIKKTEDLLTLQLERTKDILKAISERKTTQFVVGFAAETEQVEENALDKLRRKNCDLIVANDVTEPGAGFGYATNIVKIYDANGLVEALPIMQKEQVAERLLELIAKRMSTAGSTD